MGKYLLLVMVYIRSMQRTSRRRFVTGVGTVSTTVIGAGCTTNGNDAGNGNNSTEAMTAGGGDSGSTEETTAGSTGGSTTNETVTTGSESRANGSTTVAAGPNGNLVFTPKTVEIVVGDTVTWEFKSLGHNVSAKPGVDKVQIPQNAEPFASYKDDNTYAVVEKGATYKHTFETPGKYDYVCVPHISSGMVGTVIVSE